MKPSSNVSSLISFASTLIVSSALSNLGFSQGFANPPLTSEGYVSPSQLYQVRAARGDSNAVYETQKSCEGTANCERSTFAKGSALYLSPLARGLVSFSVGTSLSRETVKLSNGGYSDIKELGGSSSFSFRFGPMVSAGIGLEYGSKDFSGLNDGLKRKAFKGSARATFGASLNTSLFELSVGEKLSNLKGAIELADYAERSFLAQTRVLGGLKLGVRYDFKFFSESDLPLKDQTASKVILSSAVQGMNVELTGGRTWNYQGRKGLFDSNYGGRILLPVDSMTLIGFGYSTSSSKSVNTKSKSMSGSISLVRGF